MTLEDVREIAAGLPRSYEVVVHGRVKFRIGQIVWLAFSKDETEMGFAFATEFRDGLIESRPDAFFLPRPSELRFNWIETRLAKLEPGELRDLVLDAWAFCVPRRVAEEYAPVSGLGPGLPGQAGVRREGL